jgi:signal transduction histidine kinase
MDGRSGNGGASLAGLCSWLQQSADQERRRLGRLLHDSAAQTLAAASMNLTLVERNAAPLGSAARAALEKAQELVTSCCRELADLSYRLAPLTPGENGLAAALRGLATRAGPARLQLTVGTLPPLDPGLEEAAYRLVEDTLAAFAGGASVTAQVSPAPDGSLLVSMVGRARADAELRLTTLALRQRVRGVGGRLRVRYGTRQTSIEARLPVRVST